MTKNMSILYQFANSISEQDSAKREVSRKLCVPLNFSNGEGTIAERYLDKNYLVNTYGFDYPVTRLVLENGYVVVPTQQDVVNYISLFDFLHGIKGTVSRDTFLGMYKILSDLQCDTSSLIQYFLNVTTFNTSHTLALNFLQNSAPLDVPSLITLPVTLWYNKVTDVQDVLKTHKLSITIAWILLQKWDKNARISMCRMLNNKKLSKSQVATVLGRIHPDNKEEFDMLLSELGVTDEVQPNVDPRRVVRPNTSDVNFSFTQEKKEPAPQPHNWFDFSNLTSPSGFSFTSSVPVFSFVTPQREQHKPSEFSFGSSK